MPLPDLSPTLLTYGWLFVALDDARLPRDEFRDYGEQINKLQARLLSRATVPNQEAFSELMEVAFARLREIALDERGAMKPDGRFLIARDGLRRASLIGARVLPDPV
jgi:hypothetical protein